MAVSSRPDHFFQTTATLDDYDRKSRKSSNTLGHPIKLPSKILAVTSNPSDNDLSFYIAEAAGTLKQISLNDDRSVKRVLKGPTAPLTSLCFGPDGSTFAGCWDKTVWQFQDQSKSTSTQPKGQSAATTVKYAGHNDFVKCVLFIQLADKTTLLISGGADGDILFWDVSQPGGRPLHRLSPQCRAIECLILDPLSIPTAPVVFFSTSQRDIYSFTLPSSSSTLKSIQLSSPIIAHETSVYKLYFDSDGDLWTASADKTSKHLVREDGWNADTTLTHPDFVRDVVVHERGGWVISACRDEEVRVWNRATGQLHHTFSGHFEEVTGLCLLGDLVVSVSIDSTARTWDLSPASLRRTVEEAKNPKTDNEVEQQQQKSKESAVDGGGAGVGDSGLTEEEEAELRALMEQEESDLMDRMAVDEQ